MALRVALSALSAAAGVVHLAMVPSHWGESPVEGFGFAIVGWFQIAVAVALILRPRTWFLALIVWSNFAFVATWVVSRTWGLPFGPHAGNPHDAGFVDLVCVGIEIALIGAALYARRNPAIGRDWSHARLALFAFVPISVLALATAALASPSARNHAEASHGGHTHASGTTAATGHEHAATEQTAASGHHHFTAADRASGLTTLENGHQHGGGPDVVLDNASQAALSVQLAQTTRLVEKYPTVAAAEAGGYRRAGRFNPGLGVHYTGGGGDGIITGVNGEFMSPTLIYRSTEPDALLVGFMYSANGVAGGVPDGFVGPNDHWHLHENLCILFTDAGIRTLDSKPKTITKEICDKGGGQFIVQTGYMVHVWTVPGFESSLGVFSGVNPKMTCPDGSYHSAAPGEGTPTSNCASA